MFLALALLLGTLSIQNSVEAVLNANVWQTTKGDYPSTASFPELSDESILSKPNTAIAFSGGGARSYTATLGYLAGLHQLGLMENVRYISGISGGSWATAVYNYAQSDVTDDVLLGPIVPPSEIVFNDLQKMDPNCARSFTRTSLVEEAFKALKENITGVDHLADAWCYAMQEQYFDPVGIKRNTRFSLNKETVDNIKKRNPELRDEEFLLPSRNSNRPFMILGTAIVGPNEGAPYPAKSHNFTMIEMTPLYVGNGYTLDVSYRDGGKLIHRDHINTHHRTVGGFVETFAFGKSTDSEDAAPRLGLQPGETTGTLRVPDPDRFLDMQYAAGSSGYAPASFFESGHIPGEPSALGLHFSYWSPTERLTPKGTDMLFTDGGCLSDVMLISFLQRRVSNIVLFLNKHTPMKSASDWNVDEDPPSADQIDDGFQAYFGVLPPPDNRITSRAFQIEKNQVFATEDYYKVIHAMQDAQSAGKGVVVSMNLTTVENEWWGIPAGLVTEVTFVYLSRLSHWESQLSEDMQKRVIPSDGDPNDMSNTIDNGIFRHFPHYYTSGGLLTHLQTNLLADMSGWLILENRELFERVLHK